MPTIGRRPQWLSRPASGIMIVLFSIGNPLMNCRLGSNLLAPGPIARAPLRLLSAALLCLAFCVQAQEPEPTLELSALATERELITTELTQIQKTIALLQGSARPNGNSGSSAVQQLNVEAVQLKQRLIELSQQEIALLEPQVSNTAGAPAPEPGEPVIESKPIRTQTPDYTLEAEAAQVTQLQRLLREYYAEEDQSQQTQPTTEELAERESALRAAEQLAKIPFNASKVRLSGAEGSAALAEISQRLANPDLPESRRDSAPLCSVKTHLFGTMIASERRTLAPVGKHHYITRIQLQPGDTTVRIQGYRWQVSLPEDIHSSAYLITLYKPPGATPEFHIFSVDELLAVEQAHIPAWLPEQLGLATAG